VISDNQSSKNELKNDNDLIFLDQKARILKKEDKAREYELIIEQHRYLNSDEYAKEKFKRVKAKISEHRNPNVENIIKDIRPDYKKTLEYSLRNEFNNFIDNSVKKSAHIVRSVLEKQQETKLNSNDINNHVENIFITQETDKEVTEIIRKDQTEKTITSDSFNKLPTLVEPKVDPTKNLKSTPRNKTPNKSCIESEKSNLQLALLTNYEDEDSELNGDKSSLIKLKKIVDTIKRVDLPSFQPEFHQICQYANDSDVLQFYQKVSRY
jgi:hypothetical protein